MSFHKKFSFKLLVRLAFILANMIAIALIFGDNRLFFNQILLSIILVLQIGSLIYFINHTNRELAKFILAIKYSDFSINFTQSRIGNSFTALQDAFDQIIKSYQQAKIEKEAQLQYLRMVVSQMKIGIISLQNDETITLMNKSAEISLNISGIKNWHILQQQLPAFTHTIDEMADSGRRLLELRINEETKTFSINVSSMRMLDEEFKLITFQDIKGEIEEKEIEAWHKLIRILTHEIMNSATPISSLTETMQSLLINTPITEETIEDLRFSLKTIQKRSDGMLAFIDDYRKLAKVPKPSLQPYSVTLLFNELEKLLQPTMDDVSLSFVITHVDTLTIDPHLIEQVLLNLIKNARDAVATISEPTIIVSAYRADNETIIAVSDNGSGIEENELKEIFVPFFTTKKDGSGIGLSLSKQIMHLHKGNIKVKSSPGQGSTFNLIFKN